MIIKIKSPHDYATVSGTVTVTATATSPIASMQFWLDGLHLGALQTIHPYHVNWNTTTATPGGHKLQALAQTAAGQLFTSDWIHVVVQQAIPAPIPDPDVTAPTVTITAPAAGATLRGTVSLTATASDTVGVLGVQFQANGVNVGVEDFASPFAASWNTIALADGVYVLTAIARDAAGNRKTSAGVSVTLQQTITPTPDIIPPTVALTAPADGATVSGSISVTATASDNLAVSSVQFQVDGTNLGPADTTSPYGLTWDTSHYPDGAHVLRAIAVDAAGNSTTSSTRSVTTNNSPAADVTAPTVSITSPVTGSTVEGIITIAATAADAVGVIAVQFQVNGVNQGAEDFSAPYTTSWNTIAVANGSYALTAIARDAAGNSRTSTTVTVTVNQDSTKPTIRLTSPLGIVVSGLVTVSAVATDNIAVAGVQFFINGATLGAEDTSAPFTTTWDTTALVNGAYTISALARDAAGNTDVDARTVTVNNNTGTDILTAARLAYLGCMRVSTGVDLTFSYGIMTGRKVAGAVQLLMTGNVTDHDPVYEFLDAGSYDADHTIAPRMTLVRNWGDIYGSKRKTWLPDGTERTGFSMYPGGYYFNEDTQLLYWTYQDVYNTTGYQDWCLGASSLDVGGAVAYGPWRPSGDGKKGPQRCLRVARHPRTGKLLCGSGVVAGNAVSPWGPDVWTGDFPTTSTPGGFGNPDIPITKYLTYYPMVGQIADDGAFTLPIRACRRPGDYFFEHLNGPTTYTEIDPTKNGGVGSWTQVDGMNGVEWLDLVDGRGVIFTGRFGAAHIWYSNVGVGNYLCSHGVAPPVAITGSVSTSAYPVLMIYNPDDLENVAAGLTVDYTVNPTEIINGATTYGLHTAAITEVGSAKTISGTYFDSTSRKLYICAPQVDATNGFLNPIVHVFHVT